MMMEMAPSVLSKTQAFKMLSAAKDSMSKFKVNKLPCIASSYCLGCHKSRDVRISSEQSLAEVVWAVAPLDPCRWAAGVQQVSRQEWGNST